ncbi:hypothetical protein B0I33_111136 [Prauserella shujinwangii]|uniref:Uncharacterized protein n=1 Tax=Prauserella shujinwangii TaxID=1453103 RepID=A0A2T0LN58_9PSEU|nr:hypothetical protein [Prauserella shujinwangii]PRX44624.1 hypothetical protein B0I33_111136 [Prauserella shujinwangii]
MEFDAVADELYGADRDEFTALRDERAKAARAEGDRELAKRIKELRKPTTAAWLVNRLARRRPGEVGRLGELGDALRRAHSELAGEDLRALSRQRHELVQALTGQASELADGAVSESVTREVERTLEAALTDPEAGKAVAEGRLSSALEPAAGFSGDWLAIGPAPERRERQSREQPKRQAQREEREQREDRQAAERDRKVRDLAEARRRREERKRVRAELTEARSARNTAETELRAAEREEAKARERTEAARRTLEAAERDVQHAEQRLANLEQARE